MGDVWEATHIVTGRAVAIKRLRLARDAEPGSSAHARFVLEAQAACAVEHPNVVEILDFIESTDESPIIVMELLRGETLATRLEREQVLSVEPTARLLLPVVSAVGTAHARGIVHRDLKPANIFLQAGGKESIVKVLDFGIAKWIAAGPTASALRTETGSTLGTPCYMAPEQALGERIIDHRADIWALGVILYECLSGIRPVEGENAAGIMVRLMSTGIMPLERLVPGLPDALAELVMRMLSRNISERPRSLTEVRAALETFTNVQCPIFGEPRLDLGGLTRSSAEQPPSTTAPPLATPLHRQRVEAAPPRPPPPVGAVLLGAVTLAALAWGLRAERKSSAVGSMPSEAPTKALASSEVVAAPARPQAEPTPQPAPPSPRAASRDSSNVAPATSKRSAVVSARRPSLGARISLAGSAPTVAETPEPIVKGRLTGEACERSRECESRLCLALVCK